MEVVGPFWKSTLTLFGVIKKSPIRYSYTFRFLFPASLIGSTKSSRAWRRGLVDTVWSHRKGKGSERRGQKGNGTNREITLNEIGFSQFIVGGCHKEVEKEEVCVRLTAEKPQIKSN